jgi:hypothetical protein
MEFLRSAEGYKRKNQIRKMPIREELNIFKLNNIILKSRSQWKYHMQQMEDKLVPKKILTYSRKGR